MDNVKRLGGEDWFQLGDKDLALHVLRTLHLQQGGGLSDFVARAAQRFGITASIVPVTDAPLRTMIETDEGVLPFQRYFVERRCAPAVQSIRFDGATDAAMAAGALRALSDPDLHAIILCPSNPYLSVDPILAVPGIRAALQNSGAPVIAVSPIVGGQAIKGPTAKIMAELKLAPTQASIAAHYHGLIDALVVDVSDATEAEALAIPAIVVPTVMKTLEQKIQLARDVVSAADAYRAKPRRHRR